MATVKELVTHWGFSIDTKPIEDANVAMKGLGVSVAGVAASLAAAAGAMFGLAKLTANAGEEALKASIKTGIEVEQLQRLSHAAHMADLSHEEFQTSLKFLAKNMVEASKGGGDAADAFRKLGVGVRGANGQLKGADQALLEMADRFQKLPDGPEKTALAMKVFGRAGQNMLPMLKQGSAGIREMMTEADALGLVFTKEAAEAANEFNDNLKRAMGAITGVRNAIGNQLIPIISPLLKEFSQFIAMNRNEIVEGLAVAFKELGKYVRFTWNFFKALVTSAKGFIKLFGGFERVMKVLSIIAGVLAAGIVLKAIGAMTVAVWGLVSAFTAANIAALAIPLAIGAAVVLVGLIIEDIVTFFQGGDSFFGDLVNIIKTEFPNAFKFLKGIFDFVSFSVQATIKSLMMWFDILMKGGKAVYDFLSPLFSAIGTVLDKIGGVLGPILGKMGTALSLTANMASASLRPGVNQANTQNVAVNAPIQVNAGGLAPGQAAKAVESGVAGGVSGATMRGADRAFQGGVAY